MNLHFIPPTLSIFQKIDDVLTPKEEQFEIDWGAFYSEKRIPPFTWEDLFSAKAARRSIVLGEPGCGKSTLLSEVLSQANGKQKEAVFIPLNSLGKDIHRCIDTAQILETANREDTDEHVVYRTKGFHLEDQDKVILCFDALDEVSETAFNRKVDQIRQLSENYPNTTILISCRRHYLKDSLTKLRQLEGFTYITVNPFSNAQIEAFLKAELKEKATPGVIEAILRNSETSEGGSILKIPRYLKVFSDILQERPLDEVLKMKRVELFEKAIYHKLESEIRKENQKGEKPINPNEGLITKRVLEKLALVMEIYQRNKITKEEMVTFLDETASNTNLIFLNHLNIDTFIKRVLKNIGENIEFDNTEFQEYLAAKELLRLGRKSQILYDLITEPNFRHIYRNWYDVLRYVIELDPAQMMPLLDHLNQKGSNLVADDFFKLLFTVDADLLEPKDKGTVFSVVFSYFQQSSFYLGYEQAAKLAQFFIPTNLQLLRNNLTDAHDDIRKRMNITMVIRFLFEKDCLQADELLFWKDTLRRQAEDVDSPQLQINSLYALGCLQELTVFEQLDQAVEQSQKDVQTVFLYRCFSIDPNSPFTVRKVLAHLKESGEHAESLLNLITGNEALKIVIRELQQDEQILRNVSNNFSSYSLASFKNILNAWDEELEQELKKLLAKILSADTALLYDAGGLIKQLATLLCQQQESYLIEFLDILPEEVLYMSYAETFFNLLKPHLVDEFVTSCSSSRRRRNFLIDMLRRSKHIDHPHKEEIYEAGRGYFPEEYESWESSPGDPDYRQKQMQAAYARFQDELEPIKGHFNTDVFSTYYHNKEGLTALIQEEELQRLKNLLLNLFESVTPESYEVAITDVTDSSKSFHINNSYFFSFGLYLKVALALGLHKEMTAFRKKLVQYLAVASSEDVGLLLQHLAPLSAEDVQQLIDFCLNRSDDLLVSSTRGLIKVVEVVQRKEFIPILKGLIVHDKLHQYEREEALECLGSIFPDKPFLQETFNASLESGEVKFALIANAYLIKKFKDMDAIRWRFERAKSWKENVAEIGLYLPEWELEAHQPSYFSCAFDTGDPLFIPFFNDMLAYSIEIRKEQKHLAYSNYIQRSVFLFYDNLRFSEGFRHLKGLKSFLSPLSYSGQITGFEPHLRNLELRYVEEAGRPSNMADCVKRYNEIKSKTYLPIASLLELRHVIEEILEEDINNFIQHEGFYRPIAGMAGTAKPVGKKLPYISEDAIQKTLKIQLENGLLKRGFRSSDIIREAQLYDDKRLDLLVSYGFIGPVMLELKLLHNNEVTNSTERTKYKQKLKQYLTGSHAQHGFYVLFKVKTGMAADRAFGELEKEYKDLDNLTVKKLNCVV